MTVILAVRCVVGDAGAAMAETKGAKAVWMAKAGNKLVGHEVILGMDV